MNHKKAVLVTSFGTSHLDTMEKAIAAIEQAIHRTLPDFTLRRAFTSNIIMKKLKQRDGLEIDNVTEALTRLVDEGYEQAVIQPTHILCGEEYEKLCSLAAPFVGKLTISMGTPLLRTIDQHWALAKVLKDLLPQPKEDEAILFMGHGSPHYANAAYALLQYLLTDMGCHKIFIGTVEGLPTLVWKQTASGTPPPGCSFPCWLWMKPTASPSGARISGPVICGSGILLQICPGGPWWLPLPPPPPEKCRRILWSSSCCRSRKS